jgi:ribosomal protein S17E
MIVRIDESFVKDISKIKDKKLRSKVADYIEQVRSSDKVSEITGIKKLTGLKRSIV